MASVEKHLKNYFKKDLDDEDKELYKEYIHLNSSIKKLNINIGITKFFMSTSALVLVNDSITSIINNNKPTIVEALCLISIFANNYLYEYFDQEKSTNTNEKISIYTKIRRKELACKTSLKGL